MAKKVSKEVAQELGKAYSKELAQEQGQEYERGKTKGVEGYRVRDIRKYGYYSGLYAPGEFFARGYVYGWNTAHIENNGLV